MCAGNVSERLHPAVDQSSEPLHRRTSGGAAAGLGDVFLDVRRIAFARRQRRNDALHVLYTVAGPS
jgi:hypothetical protein